MFVWVNVNKVLFMVVCLVCKFVFIVVIMIFGCGIWCNDVNWFWLEDWGNVGIIFILIYDLLCNIIILWIVFFNWWILLG